MIMRALRVCLLAGEESGDHLGAALMAALRRRYDPVEFAGVGGKAMAAAGLPSLFPIEELSIVGFAAIPGRLPGILRRIAQTAASVVALHPDVLIIVDSPEFTHRVARRVRAHAPSIPIIAYVSPSVWAWRPGRARAMRAYVDQVLATLPFEPRVHERLGGPPCVYVGHPLTEDLSELRPSASELIRRQSDPPLVLVLPGSRPSEVQRLLAPFGAAISLVAQQLGPLELVLPTLPALAQRVQEATQSWPLAVRVTTDLGEKRAAFRAARAGLAASGTVTLELALAKVPLVAAYRVAGWEAWLARRLIRVPSAILVNLLLDENVVPEFLQSDCVPGKLATALAEIINSTPLRNRQLEAFARLETILQLGEEGPSEQAASAVLAAAGIGKDE